MSPTEGRKELTKQLIAASFKELLIRCPFDKISIKMIVDGADIRRPSFYNHFLDKYDLLEWIVATEVIAPAQKALDTGRDQDAWRHLYQSILDNEVFYRKAFSVTGQNGFEEAFVRQLTPLTECYLARTADKRPQPSPLSEREMAIYYALVFSTGIKAWLFSGKKADTEELLRLTHYLMDNIPKPLSPKEHP